jgi:uncharacterized protein (UPF0276 family)
MLHMPELGVGIIYWSGLEPVLAARPDLVDVIELEPQSFWFSPNVGDATTALPNRMLDRVAELGRPLLVHGVGLPVGGTVAPPPAMVTTFRDAVTSLAPQWISEHLSFDRVALDGHASHTGFLLPPRQDGAGVALAATNLRRLREMLGRPLAFETGVNYLGARHDEMPDGEFFAAVAEEADCGILLDLHNLYCNERNGRDTVDRTLSCLPLERVWEIHLAGGQQFGRFWLDAHSNLVPEAVMASAHDLVPHLPSLGAIVFEIMSDYLAPNDIGVDDLVGQLEAIHELWDRRRRDRAPVPMCAPQATMAGRANGATPNISGPTGPESWERELGSLVLGQPAPSTTFRLDADDGVPVLRHLVHMIRAGHAVTVLPLTYRLLRARLGRESTMALLERFWDQMPPEPLAIDEATQLAQFLAGVNIEHLDEVVAFELALRRQVLDGEGKRVSFTTEPNALLSALGEGLDPPPDSPGFYEVVIGAGAVSRA